MSELLARRRRLLILVQQFLALLGKLFTVSEDYKRKKGQGERILNRERENEEAEKQG